jgi:hypothetical protein
METRFELLPADTLEIICDFLEGHDLQKLLACGCHRLASSVNSSVRRFHFRLQKVESFPFYAFNLDSAVEIQVELDTTSFVYPAILGNRDLLPQKPMKSLKKLAFRFHQSPSILNHGYRLAASFPNITDLKLISEQYPITNKHLEALPSTLRRLDLDGGNDRTGDPSNEAINLTLLAKVSQNLEVLRLNRFPIELAADENVEDFAFSDSILDLELNALNVGQLLTKLPRYIEHVDIELSAQSPMLASVPISSLPVSLRTFTIRYWDENATFVVDGPFPPHLELWSANVNWDSRPENFTFPPTLKVIDCPWEVFGSHLERAPKTLTRLYACDYDLEEAQFHNFPASLSELHLGRSFSGVYSMLPHTLRHLHLIAVRESAVLTRAVCETLEALEALNCELLHLESVACLGAFKCLNRLLIDAEELDLPPGDALFAHLAPSCMHTLEVVSLGVIGLDFGSWPIWIAPLKECPNLNKLSVRLEMRLMARADNQPAPNQSTSVHSWMPFYLKSLPPSLTALIIPPMKNSITTFIGDPKTLLSSPEFHECFHRFPKTLTNLSFGYQVTKLDDECFAHLPSLLTRLDVSKVTGITDRFWQLIPPHIADFQFNPSILAAPSFSDLRNAYRHKLESLMGC